jgi:hypothetical protein
MLVVAFGVPERPSTLSPQEAAERPAIVGLWVTVDEGAPARIRNSAGQQATVGRIG